MSLYFEFKPLENAGTLSTKMDPARDSSHTRDNLAVTPTGSWATSIAARTKLETPELVVITNAGATAVRVAQSESADPPRFHVIAPGSQRAFEYVPGLPVKVRTI